MMTYASITSSRLTLAAARRDAARLVDVRTDLTCMNIFLRRRPSSFRLGKPPRDL